MRQFYVTALAVLLSTNASIGFSGHSTVSDQAELKAAIEGANFLGSGTIQLSSRLAIVVDHPLPTITGNVILEGNGAVIRSETDYQGALLKISENGQLKMSELTVTGFDREDVSQPAGFLGLVDNRGTLQLSNVTFSENPMCGHPCQESLPILHSSGTAHIDSVTFYKNRTAKRENVINCGEMRIVNTTFAENSAGMRLGVATVLSPIPGAISSCEDSETQFGNTLLHGGSGTCGLLKTVTDLGGNFDSDDLCGFDPDISLLNGFADLGPFGLHGGLVPTVALEPGSGAIDIGVNEVCSAMDARTARRPVRGLLGNEVKCDAGAFEYGGGFGNSDLSVNGMNGLWFDLASDGHYIHVMRVSSNRVYINWTAFDHNADQMWIYAVAETAAEKAFSATAYINLGNQLVTGGAPIGHQVEEWGRIEIEFADCTSGLFKYKAFDSVIGEGQFNLDRLAFYEGGGCTSE